MAAQGSPLSAQPRELAVSGALRVASAIGLHPTERQEGRVAPSSSLHTPSRPALMLHWQVLQGWGGGDGLPEVTRRNWASTALFDSESSVPSGSQKLLQLIARASRMPVHGRAPGGPT